MSSLRRALPPLLSAMLLTAPAAAAPVILDFDTLPPPPWTHDSCDGLDSNTVSGGVLTIDSPSCSEWSLHEGQGEWHQKVSNAKGWAIETRLRIDPASQDQDSSAVMLWINDHTNMLIVGLTRKQIRLEYPESDGATVDTTDTFHVVRIVSQLNHVRIYVDGTLRINHTLTQTGAGTNSLFFGDGDGGAYSRSYWDYLWYDVDCGPACDPGGACTDGAPCDDGDACTQNDVCAKGVCAGVAVSCSPIDECHEAGSCVPSAGCTEPPKPDGTPCSSGVCVGGACTGVTSTTSSSSSASGAGGGGGNGGSGGAGRVSSAEEPLYGRAGCYCTVNRDDDGSPAWLLAGLFAVWRSRKRR